MADVKGLLGGRSIESILDAAPASDPEVRSLISLLVGTIPTTFFVKPILFPWVVLQSTVQSLRHGNVEDSCIAYCCYGVIVDDVDEAFRLSEMSLSLNGKFGDAKRRSAVLYLHAAPHNYRKRPFAAGFPMLEGGFVSGQETGDLLHASYCAIQHVTQAVESGMAFDHLAPLIDRYVEFTRRTRNPLVERSLLLYRQYVAALQGRTRGATSLDGDGYDEKASLELFATTGFSPSVACHHIRKLVLAVAHGQFGEALEHADRAAGVLWAVRCMPLEAAFHFHHALALAGSIAADAATAPTAAEEAREKREEREGRLAEEEAWMARAAGHCPENFGARHLLVAAERARIQGKDLETLRLYEKAAESAEGNGLLLDEGLIHEAAFRFNRDRGLERAAMHHLSLARSAYRRLGADGKVGLLDVHHPELRREKRVGRDSSFESYGRQFDILSVAKASQAISGEILLDGLLRKVMAAMLEQAGAQWGSILLRKGDRYAWAAEATLADDGALAVRLAPESGSPEPPPRPLPQTILDFAARSKKRVILENAATDASFSKDPYVAGRKPKSVLCMPILRQGEPSGLLYLENDLLAGAFTPDKLEILELMASQAAISLENARLYDGLRREYAERKQVEEQLRHSQKMDALGTLAAGIAHDFNNLLTAILGYSEMALVGMPPGDRLYQPMREVLKSGERAAGLTRQLLAYSRKQVLSPKLWSLDGIVRGMESMLQRLIGETVAMEVRLGADEARVRADRGQVEQILMNLVVNARDAMPGGGHLSVETARVDLDAAFCGAHPGMLPGAYVLLSVRDDGTGMEPEVRAKLFEPFFTTKGVGKGTGLGLAVVYGIVHQSGGGIAVDSEPGKGATFRIYLPRAGEGAEDAESGPLPGKGLESRGGETVLLVEDEESVRRFTSQALESQGYRVLSYARGRDALQAMELGFPEVHLAVSDIVMPDMGGKELAERLRKLRPGLPILFISGYADQPEGHDPLRGESLLQKPFGLAEILGRVRDILRTAA
jgi:signal transduction histidine kinase